MNAGARRNTARLLAHGAREIAPGHYPLILALHGGWVLCLIVLGYDADVRVGRLILSAIFQAFRLWIVVSPGSRWTTRIIVTDTPLVVRDPYRRMRHPDQFQRRTTPSSRFARKALGVFQRVQVHVIAHVAL